MKIIIAAKINKKCVICLRTSIFRFMTKEDQFMDKWSNIVKLSLQIIIYTGSRKL